nr:BTAD domain-containing putative transcriptional regulator [Nocardiopsis mwathae]
MGVDRRWEFRLLGPLWVGHDGRPLALRSGKQQVLLAALLLSPGDVVAADELIDTLWGERPPGGARGTLQAHVMRLRRALRAGGDDSLIDTASGGYRIRVAGDQVDVARFHRLRSRVAEAAARGARDEESGLLAEALGLWRGPALAGLESDRLRAVAAGLDELRWAAVERRNEVELELGRHDSLIDELGLLVVEQPLREGFWAQLMRALHRSGRQAQALDAYRRAREVLADELGVDPNVELRELHMEVLAASTDPREPDGPTAPSGPVESAQALADPERPPVGEATPRSGGSCHLPPDVADFTGRESEVELLRAGLDAERSCAVQWTITGPGGAGKTSLAVHAAHLVRDRYPDGQLYLDLRGTGSHPVRPEDALDRLLRGLGTPGAAIPPSLDHRTDLYRERLADRRVLVILDNAADEAQVRPLLPGTPASAVLVTSRGALAGLGAARVVRLGVLSPAGAVRLLRSAVGEARVAAEPEAAAEIADYCGRLPLALRVAAARMVARPHWRLSQLAARLSDERRRFDELRVGDLDVRTSLASSYEGLETAEQRAFRLLSLQDAADFPAWVAAPLLDMAPDRAEDLVEALVDARLVEYVGRDALGQARYRLHDLLRVFGREAAAGERPEERIGALADVWRELAERANVAMSQHGPRMHDAPPAVGATARTVGERVVDGDAAAWFDAEWHSLRSVLEQCADFGLHTQAVRISAASAAFCDLRARFSEWDRANGIGAAALRRGTAADPHAEAVLTLQRGLLRVRQHRFIEAAQEFERARDGFAGAGDTAGCGHAWHGIGWMHEWQGRQDAARRCHQQALAHLAEAGDARGELDVLCSLGAIERRAGAFDAAVTVLDRACALARAGADERSRLAAVLQRGRLHQAMGELSAAHASIAESLELAQGLGDPDMTAHLRLFLAEVLLRSGRPDAAREQVDRALAFFTELGDLAGRAWSWRLLSEVASGAGDAAAGLELADRAVAAASGLGLPHEYARALRQQGRARAGAGRFAEAERSRRAAVAVFEEAGFPAEAAEVRDEAERLAADR